MDNNSSETSDNESVANVDDKIIKYKIIINRKVYLPKQLIQINSFY